MMNSFTCEKRGSEIVEGDLGVYFTRCDHYPRDGQPAKPDGATVRTSYGVWHVPAKDSDNGSFSDHEILKRAHRMCSRYKFEREFPYLFNDAHIIDLVRSFSIDSQS